MTAFDKLLSGGDMRSIGKSNSVVLKILTQNDFDELFKCLFHHDRLVVMRAADIIEKVTINNPKYLITHQKEITELLKLAKNKELKWHLALIVPRLHLKNNDLDSTWNILKQWANDTTNSRIVRVNTIQGLFEMMKQEPRFEKDFRITLDEMQKENIPSLNARIRKLLLKQKPS